MAESACLMHPFSYASGFNNEANQVSPKNPFLIWFLILMIQHQLFNHECFW
ncbi:hypothetical protein LguiB_011422 [Lonicera macranthoides]